MNKFDAYYNKILSRMNESADYDYDYDDDNHFEGPDIDVGKIIGDAFDENFRVEFVKYLLFIDPRFRSEIVDSAEKDGIDGEKFIQLFADGVPAAKISEMFPDANGQPLDLASMLSAMYEEFLADVYHAAKNKDTKGIPENLKKDLAAMINQIDDAIKDDIYERQSEEDYQREFGIGR